MPKTKQMAEEIINKLREAEVFISTGSRVVEAGRRLGSSAILWRGGPKKYWTGNSAGLVIEEIRNGVNLRLNCSTLLNQPSAPGLAVVSVNTYLCPCANFNFSTSRLIPLEDGSPK